MLKKGERINKLMAVRVVTFSGNLFFFWSVVLLYTLGLNGKGLRFKCKCLFCIHTCCVN